MLELQHCQRLVMFAALRLNPFFESYCGEGDPDDLDVLRSEMSKNVESSSYGMA